MSFKPKYYLGLCGIAKNENKYLKEWVAYHHYIGFEKIYIYDNESDVALYNEVTDYLNLGICDVYEIKGEAQQNIAYNHCLKTHGQDCEWLAFFDLDEFLCLKEDDDARVVMRDYEDYAGLSVQWDSFSSSGHLKSPDNFVTLAYKESLGYSVISKCIVRPRYVKMTFSAHHFIFRKGIAVNARGEACLGAYAPLAIDKICLNHYSFRSQEDWAKKLAKTDATYGQNNPRSWESFFRQAQAKTVPHLDIVAVASCVYNNVLAKNYESKYNIFLEDLNKLDSTQLLVYLGKIVNSSQIGLAEVIFAMAFRQSSSNEDFLLLGVKICFYQQKFARAKKIIEYWLNHEPSHTAYLTYLEYLFLTDDYENAKKIYDFLAEELSYSREEKLKKELNALGQKYHLA
ncbi:MAG: glycosyltransferase family 92 protein [Desulfovibrio sp.]|nr:glycosyltransferase family 92 protein [Desulfovibrio sp.]